MWRRCLAGLVCRWVEAASAETFSGSGGLFLKARIRVRLLSSFSASSLRYASLDGDAATPTAFSLSLLGSVSR
uniref:Cell division cycle protein 20 n=1 Tax=Arundo donax TaxID=35708 RepID=A0A0A8XVR5_ARUDO